jgi:hypothetical protein
MELSKFLDVYLDCGNTLLEGKFTQDPAQAVKMFAVFAPNELPPTVRTATAAADGHTANTNAAQAQGDSSFEYINQKGVKMIAYRGKTFNPKGHSANQAVKFTEPEWNAVLGYYDQQKGNIAAEDPDMRDKEQAQTPVMDPAAPAAEQPDFLKQLSEEATQKDLKVLEEMGYTGPDVTKWAQTFNDQARGLGTVTKMRKASLALQGKENVSVEETEAAAQKLSQTAMRAMGLAYKLKNKIITPDKLSQEDVDFLKCFRCRNKGTVHVQGGDKCGGDIATLGATMDTDAGKAFGMQIGTKDSLVAKDLCRLTKIEVDGKPLILKGRSADRASEDTYRAIAGDMNEYSSDLAQAIFVKKDKKAVKKVMESIVAGVGDKLDLKLFLEVAQARAGGSLEDVEVINFVEEGANELLEEATAELGETPDEKRALAWLLSKQVSGWKPIVEQFPPDCEFRKVGTEGAGILGDGTVLNADVEVACAEGSTLDKVVNKKFDVKGNRAAQSKSFGDVVRISVKNGFGGKTIEFGKRSFLKLRGSADREAVTIARQSHAAALSEITRNHGVDLPDDWLEQADEFRDRSTREVDRMMGALDNISSGALKDWTTDQMSKVPFNDLKKQKAFYDKLKEYKKTKDPKVKLRLRAESITQMTQMYAAKHSNEPGFRYNCVLDAAVCGMSTERQMFALTNPDGNSMIGMETDAVGPSLLKILSGEADIRVLGSGTNFVSEDGKLLSRLRIGRKGTSANTHYIVAKDEVTSGLEKAQSVGNSSMKAEDFVRHLQELIQRIDEVSTV